MDTLFLFVLDLVIWSACVTCIRGQDCATKYTKFPGHTACLPQSPKLTAMEMTAKEKQAVVDLHNELRAKVKPPPTNMLKMTWDDEVALLAKKWVDSCRVLSGGTLSHDKGNQRLIPGRFSVSQNLAAGHGTFAHAIKDWYAEEKDYTYGKAYRSINAMVGHYTQLVWAKSYKLGCAKAKCSDVVVYACNYSPAGNMVPFKQPYETGKAPLCKKTSNGLCDCGDMQCVNGSPLNVSTCTCDCSKSYSLGPDCKLSCDFKDPFYCGKAPFDKAGCTSSLAVSISQKCLHMCDVCPYALEGDGDDNGGGGGDNGGDGDNSGGSIDDNNAGDGIDYNKVGDGIDDNNVGDGIDDNNVGDGIDDNNVGDGIDDNNVGDGIDDNNVGDGIDDNNGEGTDDNNGASVEDKGDGTDEENGGDGDTTGEDVDGNHDDSSNHDGGITDALEGNTSQTVGPSTAVCFVLLLAFCEIGNVFYY